MDLDFFKWALGTGVAASIVFLILNMITTNDLFAYVGLFAIFIVSLMGLSSKLPSAVSFKSGAILCMVCMTAMIIVGQIVYKDIVDWIVYLALYVAAFVIGGYAAKYVPGLLSKKDQPQQPIQQAPPAAPPQPPPQQPPAV